MHELAIPLSATGGFFYLPECPDKAGPTGDLDLKRFMRSLEGAINEMLRRRGLRWRRLEELA
ncbi:hypothetical protein CVM73_08330 [Bradyrhizobium forestalis]|uniref:Uncharacterized protein n=1 Tax=Bradyrhizobium forestalis TaxID=1419263 RepID=A0A2M8RCL5_9BRAD|nr:hypothetical protein CVM73_08330 [Bradyrhizobium forestalis]